MNDGQRQRFDRLLEEVLADLPPEIHRLLEEVPLLVEDRLPRDELEEMGLPDARELAGLYTGIPLTVRSVEHSGTLPDKIRIFREGVVALAFRRGRRPDDAELRKEIRTTVLHEVGHHFGFGEKELRKLGY